MGMFSRGSAGYLVLAAGLALTLTGPSLAQSLGQEVTIRGQKQLVESLRSGGYVIVVRHGATFSDQADTDPFNFDNIPKQRNLNEKGKELARALGDAVRPIGMPVGEVYTSHFNRAFETAVLAGFKGIEKTTERRAVSSYHPTKITGEPRHFARCWRRCPKRAKTPSSSRTSPTSSMPWARTGSM